ncbi:MAG: hypothetical protein JNN30_02990 [Rhodanobacteraceae bacterium]|nr:hypothetical protein [Rhodanobacteraceae bacterium]
MHILDTGNIRRARASDNQHEQPEQPEQQEAPGKSAFLTPARSDAAETPP